MTITSSTTLRNQLLDDIEILSFQPYMGMECQEYLLMPDHFRRIVSGVYLCFYRTRRTTHGTN